MLATLVDEPFHKPGLGLRGEVRRLPHPRLQGRRAGHAAVAQRQRPYRVVRRHRRRRRAASRRARCCSTARRSPSTRSWCRASSSCSRARRRSCTPPSTASTPTATICATQPLTARRAILEQVIDGAERTFAARRLASNGLAALRDRAAQGLRGPGREGRERRPTCRAAAGAGSRSRCKHEDEFVIGGYTEPAGTRARFGALLLGGLPRRQAVLRRQGRHRLLARSASSRCGGAFARSRPATPAFVDPPRGRGLSWLAPKLVAQVAYTEWTADRKLRQPGVPRPARRQERRRDRAARATRRDAPSSASCRCRCRTRTRCSGPTRATPSSTWCASTTPSSRG